MFHQSSYNHSTTAPSPPNYDLGIRFGQAPEIDQHYFVGREHELEHLQTWLEPTPGKRNIVVLHGMGGIGKTQLSIQFVRQTSGRYTSVFWLNAKDEKTLRAGLATLAVEAFESNMAAVDSDGEERLVMQARQWLSRPDNGQWLLLFDNYDDPKLPGVSGPNVYDIRAYFPPRAHGSILITTRSPRLKFGRQLSVQKLDDEGHSLSILAMRSGRSVEADPAALKLVRRLDGLPLALATAGTYLSHSADSFEDYLQLYENSWDDFQHNDHGPEDYEERTFYSTWNISFQRIQQQDAIAAELLALMAYFDNQDLWYELLHAGQDLVDAPAWWYELMQSRPRFQRAVTMLQNYSLLEVTSGGYRLHPCVHDWTLERLNCEIDFDRFRIAVRCIAKGVNWEQDDEYWKRDRRLLPHARRLLHDRFQGLVERDFISFDDQGSLGHLYHKNHMYQEAVQMFMRALAGKEKILGSEHQSTLNTVYNVAYSYTDLDQLEKAEQMYVRALAGYEKTFGPKHLWTLQAIQNLGTIYMDQGRLSEAEQMCGRALAGYEETLGRKHNSTLGTISVFGSLYQRQGKVVEAEEMYIRALDGHKEAFSSEHPLALMTANNLGGLYRSQGKLVDAEQIYVRVLAGYTSTLGIEHWLTLLTMSCLGTLYTYQEKPAEAEQMYIQVLTGREKLFGPEHTSTLTTVGNLGRLYQSQARLVEAEQMFIRLLSGNEKMLGIEHTSTLETVFTLGNIYWSQKKLVEAEKFYIRALGGYENSHGAEHKWTNAMAFNLGLLYGEQGRLGEAEQMYLRALAGDEKVHGAEHLSTLRTANNLGLTYMNQGQLSEAKQLFERVAASRQEQLGADHIDTKRVLQSLERLNLEMASSEKDDSQEPLEDIGREIDPEP